MVDVSLREIRYRPVPASKQRRQVIIPFNSGFCWMLQSLTNVPALYDGRSGSMRFSSLTLSNDSVLSSSLILMTYFSLSISTTSAVLPLYSTDELRPFTMTVEPLKNLFEEGDGTGGKGDGTGGKGDGTGGTGDGGTGGAGGCGA